MNDLDRIHKWIWLSLACGAASSLPEKLIAAFGDIDDIYNASEDDYVSLGLKINCLEALCDKNLEQAKHIVKWCEMKNVGILTIDDERYPARLYETRAFPLVLYYIGRIPEIDKRLTIACVGTRNMSDYGKDNAYTISYDLAKNGAIIVSGLAAGIDAICHRASLDAGGDTIAILGCGIDTAYPPQNRQLMVEIARKGTLLTEYAPGTSPVAHHFPQRNRIISGLSLATMVFEANSKSGSLITANLAKKQGRPVFALPGNAGVSTSLGTNELLTDGAKAATKAGDILDCYKDFLASVAFTTTKKEKPNLHKPSEPKKSVFDDVPKATVEKKKEEPKEEEFTLNFTPPKLTEEKAQEVIKALSEIERAVFDSLSRTKPKTPDEIVDTGYPLNKILAALTMLELRGLILSISGQGFVKA